MPNLTVGKNVAAALHFAMWAACIGLGYWLCWSNVLGEQASSEIAIMRSDNSATEEMNGEHANDMLETNRRIQDTPYDSDCASMSISDMRDELQ